MKGVSLNSEIPTDVFHSSGCTAGDTVCTGPLGSALYCTLYCTMRPLTSLQGSSLSHWTEMEEELRAVAIKLTRAAVEPVGEITQKL